MARCVQLPRDRDGSFAPILIPKHERRFTGSMTGSSPCTLEA